MSSDLQRLSAIKSEMPLKLKSCRANEIEKEGEARQFQDDIDYFMETLNDPKSTANLKCMSMINLTKQCVSFQFRQYLRSKPKLFQDLVAALHDSHECRALAMCVAAFFYMMSRDAAQFPGQTAPMKLIFEFLRIEATAVDAELRKYQPMVWQIILDWKKDCEKRKEREIVFDLAETTFSIPQLALFTLDYLISRAPGKNKALQQELLNLGFLQTLVAKVDKYVLQLKLQHNLSSEALTQILNDLEHTYRIIENGIMFDKRSQTFLVGHRNGLVLFSSEKYLDYFCTEIPKRTDDLALRKKLFDVFSLMMRAIMNTSHSNDVCAIKLGQIGNFISNTGYVFSSLAPRYAEEGKFSDLVLLICGLFVNISMKCAPNRRKLQNLRVTAWVDDVETKDVPLLDVVVRLFTKYEAQAQSVDQELDNEMFGEMLDDAQPSGSGEVDAEDESEETNDGTSLPSSGQIASRPPELTGDEMVSALNSAMKKATNHMQDSMVASYSALLVGCIVHTDEKLGEQVRELMPNKKLDVMLDQLERYKEFAELTKSVDVGCITSVIQTLKTHNG